MTRVEERLASNQYSAALTEARTGTGQDRSRALLRVVFALSGNTSHAALAARGQLKQGDLQAAMNIASPADRQMLAAQLEAMVRESHRQNPWSAEGWAQAMKVWNQWATGSGSTTTGPRSGPSSLGANYRWDNGKLVHTPSNREVK